jgi:predicted membrane protein
MENKDKNPDANYNTGIEKKRTNSGNAMGGALLFIIGFVLLALQLDFIFLPRWVLSWPMILIVIGLFIGFKSSFQKPSWIILILIGSVFLLDDILFFDIKVYFWPILIMGIGLWLILRPKRKYLRENNYRGEQYKASNDETYTGNYSDEEVVISTTVFGGMKKNIISKNFKGGEVVSVFGGTELNLMQADIQHPIVLEATQIFGGTTLILPAHWQVKSEVVAILGGVDDKRPVMAQGYDPNKVIILKGTSLFGGLSLKSY